MRKIISSLSCTGGVAALLTPQLISANPPGSRRQRAAIGIRALPRPNVKISDQPQNRAGQRCWVAGKREQVAVSPFFPLSLLLTATTTGRKESHDASTDPEQSER